MNRICGQSRELIPSARDSDHLQSTSYLLQRSNRCKFTERKSTSNEARPAACDSSKHLVVIGSSTTKDSLRSVAVTALMASEGSLV